MRPLINCKEFPIPKEFKPGARLNFREPRIPSIRSKGYAEQRGVQAIYGFDTGKYAPVAFASNAHNEKQALIARVLSETQEPDPEELTNCIHWCWENRRELFPRMRKIRSVPWSEYLRRSNASPSVKKTLSETKALLDAEGIDETSNLPKNVLFQWTTRSSFVKVENNLYESPLGVKDKAPRLIQGATPEFICLVGPWCMAAQDVLKRRWSIKNEFLCFTSGVRADAAARFAVAGRGRMLEDDLGKFDSSIRKPWCQLEVKLSRYWGAPNAVLALMKANIQTHGRTHHGWRYKCEGTRKSGDPYTSLFNSIINGLSHLYLYCKWTKQTVAQSKGRIRMLLQGDDNFLRHAERTQFPWKQGMASLGFESKAMYRSHTDDVEFCSMRLYTTREGYTFAPKPGKVLAKLGYIINPPKNVSRESMMRGVALGLWKSCAHIAPLRCVLDRVLELTEGSTAFYQRFWDEHVLRDSVEQTESPETFLLLEDQYEWSYRKQELMEETVSGLRFGQAYKDPLVDMLFDRDTSGPSWMSA